MRKCTWKLLEIMLQARTLWCAPDGDGYAEKIHTHHMHNHAARTLWCAQDGDGYAENIHTCTCTIRLQEHTGWTRLSGLCRIHTYTYTYTYTNRLQEHTGVDRIVRAMPNTPVSIQEGCVVWFPTNEVEEPQLKAIAGVRK
jgi:hypothetical protein